MADSHNQHEYSNHLVGQTSPYLLQHAHNPVDWYPWTEQALEKARGESKPILLSIGYSACHWCHVMAHESFENQFTAEVMNNLFINIKVDREERPDLDKIYQLAHQVLTQRGGGWPLTMILTPDDQMPFFAGTYFPDQARANMPAFTEVLRRVEAYYRSSQDEVIKQNDALNNVLQQVYTAASTGNITLSSDPIDQARHQLKSHYDGLYGGFGEAPKFPHPSNIERLLRHWIATSKSQQPDNSAQDMAITSLKSMALGGIYDHLGGGFCRYSVDQEWMIPHFEKMLYDNGPLLSLYANAWCATQEPLFEKIALETAEWAIAEMQSPQGGYYSTLDADSEGKEGQFYVWTPQEVKELLDPEQYAIFANIYGLDKIANFEGHWHLHTYNTLEDAAKRRNIGPSTARELVSDARQILYRVRDLRQHPGRDEKILTAWNGLMIKGMAITGRILNRQEFIESAQLAVNFINKNLWQENRLLASYKDANAHLSAYLDDYAFLIDGLLELLQAKWDNANFDFMIQLCEVLLTHFEDTKNGGFYFTADDHEQLIQRPKLFTDEALPAGNGIAAHTLLRLGYLLGNTRYITAAQRTLECAWDNIQNTPYAHNTLLHALEEYLYPTEIIILRGNTEKLYQWKKLCDEQYRPRSLIVSIPNDALDLAEGLADKSAKGDIVAYVCQGQTCQTPITELGKLKEHLKDPSPQSHRGHRDKK